MSGTLTFSESDVNPTLIALGLDNKDKDVSKKKKTKKKKKKKKQSKRENWLKNRKIATIKLNNIHQFDAEQGSARSLTPLSFENASSRSIVDTLCGSTNTMIINSSRSSICSDIDNPLRESLGETNVIHIKPRCQTIDNSAFGNYKRGRKKITQLTRFQILPGICVRIVYNPVIVECQAIFNFCKQGSNQCNTPGKFNKLNRHLLWQTERTQYSGSHIVFISQISKSQWVITTENTAYVCELDKKNAAMFKLYADSFRETVSNYISSKH